MAEAETIIYYVCILFYMAPVYGGMVKIFEDWAIRSQAPKGVMYYYILYGEGSTTVRRTGQPEYTV